MNPAVWIISCVVAPAVRATLVPAAFIFRWRIRFLRIFASDRVANIMQKLNMPEGEAIEHPWVTRAIENAQRKVEARNFDMRKQLLEYDDVANDQRKVIYEQRNELLESQDISETITAMRGDVLEVSSPSMSRRKASRSSGIYRDWKRHWLPNISCNCRCRNGWRKNPTYMKRAFTSALPG